jgi:formylglycine-generating enzyme required for sulfatase activity
MALEENYWSNAIVSPDTLGIGYCYIPKSVFLYGRDNVSVDIGADYYLGQYPVTKSEFLTFVSETGYDYSDEDIQIMNALSPMADCPATPISWKDAKSYARWLRKKTGEYYSLPSELEWESGARGTKGNVYPWGDNEPNFSYAHFSSEIPSVKTIPVGSKPRNESPYGCRDAVGNIWEWCLDMFEEDNNTHVLRGGSCVESQDSCSCLAKKYCCDPYYRMPYAGFRLIYLPGAMFDFYRMLANSHSESGNRYTDTSSRTIIM